jgi:hypothetical protein
MADQTQSPASQPSTAVTGLTYPAALTDSPYWQSKPNIGLTIAGSSILISGLSYPVIVGGEPSYQAKSVLQLQISGTSISLASSLDPGTPPVPTTGQIWPSGFG